MALQFHQPSRASRFRIASTRANTVLAVGHVASSKVVVRIDRISRATRTHGSRYGSWFIDVMRTVARAASLGQPERASA